LSAACLCSRTVISFPGTADLIADESQRAH
jgi:hypothetical protein